MSTISALAAPARSDEASAMPVELLDQLPLLTSYVDRDLIYRFVNRAYERWFGVGRDEIVGRTIGALAGPAAVAAIRPHLEAALGGETVVFDADVPSKAGDWPARVTYTPRFDADGSVIGIYTLMEDLSAKRTADAAIGAALDGLADGYLALDSRNRVSALNGAAARFYGVDRDAALGRHVDEVWPGWTKSETAALVGRALATGRAIRHETRSFGRPDRIVMFDVVPLSGGGVGVVLHDRTEHLELKAALEAKRDLLQSVIETSPDPIFAKNLDGSYRVANLATAQAMRFDPTRLIGCRDRDLLPAPIAAELEANDARVFAGETLVAEELLEELGAASRTYLVTKAPLRDRDGAVIGLVGTARDISDRKDGERHRELLVAELNHRVKNTLAVVQSIAHQTFRPGADPAIARDDFDTRLQALAGAHDLLTRNFWDALQLEELLARVLAPFRLAREDRFELVGPTVRLDAKVAVALVLALHELATNAVKYGALSNDSGRVALHWHLVNRNGVPRLKLRWQESGGPLVKAPTHRGFGSRLIERGLQRELQGEVALEFPMSGVVCRIEMPLPY